jgi:hypothetical protein
MAEVQLLTLQGSKIIESFPFLAGYHVRVQNMTEISVTAAAVLFIVRTWLQPR